MIMCLLEFIYLQFLMIDRSFCFDFILERMIEMMHLILKWRRGTRGVLG